MEQSSMESLILYPCVQFPFLFSESTISPSFLQRKEQAGEVLELGWREGGGTGGLISFHISILAPTQ